MTIWQSQSSAVSVPRTVQVRKRYVHLSTLCGKIVFLPVEESKIEALAKQVAQQRTPQVCNYVRLGQGGP